MDTVELQAIECSCGCGESFVPKRPGGKFIRWHHNRLTRKDTVKELSEPRRRTLYALANNCCEQCGLSMEEQIVLFKRRLEIHHLDHDHSNNTEGNHRVLCTKCHNEHSLGVRDEAKKSATFRERRSAGLIKMWSEGKTKETDDRIAKMAAKKIGKLPWNKGKTKETDPRITHPTGIISNPNGRNQYS